MESEILKVASLYSKPWRAENNPPKRIVVARDVFLSFMFFFKIEW